jgi:hypothetical protein
MKPSARSRKLLRTICCVALLLLATPSATARSEQKIPREVIDQTAARGTALVLVGLKVPWQKEAQLNEEDRRAQRAAIASVQTDLLTSLHGRDYKLVRRYQEVPGIALEVGADALAELARLPLVTNVLLDRSIPEVPEYGKIVFTQSGNAAAEKVPLQLFNRAASNGTVLVLAGLRTPWQREDQLSDNLLALQRAAIQDAQSYVLAELVGTRYKVTRLYQSIPGIALRVGVDALKVLEKSPAVTNVVQDRPAQTSK